MAIALGFDAAGRASGENDSTTRKGKQGLLPSRSSGTYYISQYAFCVEPVRVKKIESGREISWLDEVVWCEVGVL